MIKQISLFLLLIFFSSIVGNACDSLYGSWNGVLEIAPMQKLNLGLNVSKASDGSSRVTLDSPLQGAFDIAGNVVFLSSDSISVAVERIGMTYTAKLYDGVLKGIFKQGTFTLALDMLPGKCNVKRSQNPKPPFPYTVSEVEFRNQNANITLRGTLTTPSDTNRKTPVVVFVSGSGLQNRDEEIFGHKPFAVIADYLARNGIASLRYDDRGYGQSQGDGINASTADFASDADAAIHFLTQNKQFNKIGVLGHSEGAEISFMLAAESNNKPSFIIAMGTPALRGDSILVQQSIYTLQLAKIDEKTVNDYRDALFKFYNVMRTQGIKAAGDAIGNICAGWDFMPVYSDLKRNIKAIADNANDWLVYTISHSPAKYISRTRCKAFALYGEKDVQVAAEIHPAKLRELNPDVEIKIYPELNHLMQHCTTGNINEYGMIDETISPDVLADIVKFINIANK